MSDGYKWRVHVQVSEDVTNHYDFYFEENAKNLAAHINTPTRLEYIGPPIENGVKEAPCSNCKRMNDIGVKTCWCCGGKP